MHDSDKDPLLKAAQAVASGDKVDWQEELEATPGDANTLNNLRRLEAISGVMRAVAGDEVQASTDELEEWGHLRLLEELGRGSFGTVYRAFDPTLQRDVAVKLRRRDSQAQSAAAWIDEARRLARIRHPNVLAVHGADTHDGVVGLWSDLMVGKTLEQTIKVDGQFSVERALGVAIQLASALIAVHKAGLVHGDLKPANVMLERGDHVVLMDFGAGSKISSDPRTSSTRIGSPLVMAPEQFGGAESSPASDVYAFGVLIYRMLSASYPVQAKSLSELREKHERGDYVELRSRRSDVPRSLATLVAELTSRSAADRPRMTEVKERLERIQNQPARRRRVLGLVSIFALLAVGLAVAVDAYLRARSAETDAEAINQFLVNILSAPRGFEQGAEVKVVDVLEQAADTVRSEFSNSPQLRARMLFVIGRTYNSLDEHEKARGFLQETLELSAGNQALSEERRLFARYLLAESLQEVGARDEAHQLAEAMMAEVQATRPPDDRFQVLMRIRLADLKHDAGEYDEAVRIMAEAVALREGEKWRDDLDGNLARLNYAVVLNSRGRFAQAEPLSRAALDFSLRVNGEHHSNTIAARHNLVVSLNQLGRYREAEPLGRQNHETTVEWLGPHSHYTGITASDLSNTLYHLGRPREALELDSVALEVNQRIYGANHLNTLMMLVNQGNRYKEIGDILAAESAYNQVNEVATEEYGESHNLVMMTRYNLSELYYETGRFEQAHHLARATHEIMLSALGADHLFSLVTEGMIGASMAALGEHAEAQARLRETLDRAQQALGRDNDYTLDIAMYLARDLAAVGEYHEARLMALDVTQRRVRMLGMDHPKTQDAQAFVDALLEETQEAPRNTTEG